MRKKAHLLRWRPPAARSTYREYALRAAGAASHLDLFAHPAWGPSHLPCAGRVHAAAAPRAAARRRAPVRASSRV